MLTVLYGNDYEGLRARLGALGAGARSVEYINPDTYDQAKITQLAAGTDLFGGQETLVLSGLLMDSEIAGELAGLYQAMQTSQNHFFIIEEKLLKKDQKPFEEVGAMIEQFALSKNTKKDDFNVFALSDALGARDKKQLWIRYQQALRANKTPEEIHGILWWQVKNMKLVALEKSNPGLHPFVFGKTQRAVEKYSDQELAQLEQQLVRSFHDTRRGLANLGRETEKLILSL